MQSRRTCTNVIAMCALSAIVADGVCVAEVIEIGSVAPAWCDLPGTDGRTYSMSDYADATVIVLIFTCNGCPYAVDYEDRIIALQTRYKDSVSGVQVVAINSNAASADSIEKMKVRSAAKKFNVPYLRDESQGVAESYGAVYTPEFFVLNGKRELVYRGAMDDNTDSAQVKVQYVALAVDSALKGERPAITEVGARGCAIRRKRRRR